MGGQGSPRGFITAQEWRCILNSQRSIDGLTVPFPAAYIKVLYSPLKVNAHTGWTEIEDQIFLKWWNAYFPKRHLHWRKWLQGYAIVVGVPVHHVHSLPFVGYAAEGHGVIQTMQLVSISLSHSST